MITLNPEQMKTGISHCWKAQLTPMLHGSPGTAKSAVVDTMANDFNLLMIDLRLSQLEGLDMNGMPRTNDAEGRFGYLPLDQFPLEGDPIPAGYDGWCLFFDEFNAGDRSTQKAAYKVIQDHAIGQFKLHPRCVKAGAGNLVTDNALVEDMGTAMASRLIHYVMERDLDGFLSWWSDNNHDHRISDFLRFKPGLFNTFTPEVESGDFTFACNRTWDFAGKLIQQMDLTDPVHHPINLATFTGTLGEGPAREFLTFCRVYTQLPTMDAILSDPQGTRVPTEPGVIYALLGSLAHHANPDNIDVLVQYISRIPADMQVVCLRDAVRRTPELFHCEPVRKVIAAIGVDLF